MASEVPELDKKRSPFTLPIPFLRSPTQHPTLPHPTGAAYERGGLCWQ